MAASTLISLRTALLRNPGKASLLALSASFTAGVVVGRTDAFARTETKDPQLCVPAFTITDQQSLLPDALRKIVGGGNVTENVVQKGTRLGSGTALAVVSPGTLEEAVEVLKACVKAGVAVIPQGAKTGLTGGSVPRDKLCDRPTVVINMRNLNAIIPVGDGEKVLCFAGAGILDLGKELEAIHRESHSVLGSIFLNPSVAAGVAFGSGGTQLHKGPAYTERALYCRVTADGEVELVNELGVRSNSTAELLAKLQSKDLSDADLDPACKRKASETTYRQSVCKLDGSVSRFNADTHGPDCNRSEGKVLILATMHDTFPMPLQTRLYWVSCKDFETAQRLKAEVYLKNPKNLPSCVEYMNRDTVEVVEQAGRGFTTCINLLGMGWLGPLWAIKDRISTLPLPGAASICDRAMWYLNPLMPHPLSTPLRRLAVEWDHHLLVETAEYGQGQINDIEDRFVAWANAQPKGTVTWHTCDAAEKEWALVFRFVTAAAFRVYCLGRGLGELNVDYSLPKNCTQAPVLPDPAPVVRMRYSHFGCNVVHEDLAFAAGVDPRAAKRGIVEVVEGLKGRLPAEHGHGSEYAAPADAQARWKRMDPTNTMNPGVGGLSYRRGYA